jgi:hypothetical protein
MTFDNFDCQHNKYLRYKPNKCCFANNVVSESDSRQQEEYSSLPEHPASYLTDNNDSVLEDKLDGAKS